jgi:HNH endonuclease
LDAAVSHWPIPSPEQQLEFLQNVLRLFEESDFTATYKYALLMALAELAVESGDDTGAPLEIRMNQLAEKFAEIYWPQTAPYSSGAMGSVPAILSQNLGEQAAIVNHLTRLRNNTVASLIAARQSSAWRPTLVSIAAVIRNMPVRYLQNIAGARVPFLYDYPPPRGRLVLKPGVAFNLRRFHGLVQQLARSAWLHHVRGNSRNAGAIGQADDLEAFMFGSARADLSGVASYLRELQSHRCFYCGERLQSAAAVDHFIPWSRYARDTAHNFVLTHVECNSDKRELLAAKRHLDAWLKRNEHYGAEIAGHLAALGFVADLGCWLMVTRWAYRQALTHHSHAWLARRQRTEPVDETYLALLQ